MSDNQVVPDEETGQILNNIFGMYSKPYKKWEPFDMRFYENYKASLITYIFQ